MKTRNIVLLSMVVVFLIGCAGLPKTTRTGAIHTIRIEKTLSDPKLTVQIGDEIRWINYRTEPVTIEFVPDTKGSFSCEKGFSDRFGKTKLSARIKAGEFVSLCFSENGEYIYNVRMTAVLIGGETIAPGVIRVEK